MDVGESEVPTLQANAATRQTNAQPRSKMSADNDWVLDQNGEERCESCDGSGEVVVGWEYPEYITCRSCGGSGRARDLLDEADEAYERYRDDRT